MTIVTWLVAGGLVGWGASYAFGTMNTEAISFNVAVSVLGAALGGWILGPMLGVAAGFSTFAIIVSAVGAAVVLLAVHFVRRTVFS